jgi:hypothetical protein
MIKHDRGGKVRLLLKVTFFIFIGYSVFLRLCLYAQCKGQTKVQRGKYYTGRTTRVGVRAKGITQRNSQERDWEHMRSCL